jgi:hypothetical protein
VKTVLHLSRLTSRKTAWHHDSLLSSSDSARYFQFVIWVFAFPCFGVYLLGLWRAACAWLVGTFCFVGFILFVTGSLFALLIAATTYLGVRLKWCVSSYSTVFIRVVVSVFFLLCTESVSDGAFFLGGVSGRCRMRLDRWKWSLDGTCSAE